MNNTDLKNTITSNLAQFKVRSAEVDQNLTQAAVALVIEAASANSEANLYLTLRSNKLRKHAGQFALPGGKLDVEETAELAACRELKEELNISVRCDSVLGRLDDFITRSGFMITPVILWKDSHQEPVPNEDEVAHFFRIPMSDLLDAALVNQPYSTINPVFSISPQAVKNTVYSPTAAIIYQFREVALLGRCTRVGHYEQPSFAWR